MIIQIRERFLARPQRERRLILLMLAIAIPVFAWLLVVQPLDRAYDNALHRHLEAIDRNGRVRSLTELGRTRTGPVAATAGAELGLVVAESASRAGLVLDSNSASGVNSVSIAIASAQPTAAMLWLRDFELQGIKVEDLRMAPAGEGAVSLTAQLVRSPR